jgi:hypothetical protein
MAALLPDGKHSITVMYEYIQFSLIYIHTDEHGCYEEQVVVDGATSYRRHL